ncbi:MAG: translocation/assembly module TamB domain-containing protein [Bryobacteraceae bacterium]|nr:translocation/assembly module TamB domain-containing protein [Bryobacteraceae bacterium]MDW8378850.1 translocation/assembly module TamB domain-containing protein [Bryobacterales bacterium]
MRNLRRWSLRLLLLTSILIPLMALAGFYVLRSQWLREHLRARILVEAEKATGGKVELRKFDFDPLALRVSVEQFVLRGKEPSGEPPLARIERIEVSLKIVSLLRRDVYVESLRVTQPRIRIITFPDGTTNIPGPPATKNSKSVFEQFVALSARQFELQNGVFEYDHQRLALSLQAEDFRVHFAWLKPEASYQGEVSAAAVRIAWPPLQPLSWRADIRLKMDKLGLRVDRAELRHHDSTLVARGALVGYRNPTLRLDVDAVLPLSVYAQPLRLPLLPVGVARFLGQLRWSGDDYLLSGLLQASGLGIQRQGWTVSDIAVTTDVHIQPRLVSLAKLRVSALGGGFQGSGQLQDWKNVSLRGVVSGLSLDGLRLVQPNSRPFAWSGVISGPVELAGALTPHGIQQMRASCQLVIEPGQGRVPVAGLLRSRYSERDNSVRIDPSFLRTPHTRIDFQGQASDRIRVQLDSSDLNDFLPVLVFLSDQPPPQLPVQLDGGRLRFDGMIVSPLQAPRVRGSLDVTAFVVEKRRIDHLSTSVDWDATHVVAHNLRLEQKNAVFEGDLQISLQNWVIRNDDSQVIAHINLRQASLAELLKSSQGPDLNGFVSGQITVEGTVADPEVHARLTLSQMVAAGEPVSQVRLQAAYAKRTLEVGEGFAEGPAGRLSFRGRYTHHEGHLQQGKLEWQAEAKALQLAGFETLRRYRNDFRASADLKAGGSAQVLEQGLQLDSLNLAIQLREASLGGRPVGDLELRTLTNDERLVVSLTGRVLGTPVQGRGEWSLRPDSSGVGEVEFGAVSFAKLRDLLPVFGFQQRPPFEGALEGSVIVTGSLQNPQSLRARIQLSRFQLQPSNPEGQFSPSVVQELTLRNTAPFSIELDRQGIRLMEANFTGKDTNMKISGGVSYASRPVWNLNLSGGLNLGLFQNYVPGLRTTGQAVVNATLRGPLSEPQLGGRMEIRDASLYHRDIPNGLDKAAGVVTFDRNRALLQNFTAQSGGGDLKLNGFISFGASNEPVSYRVNGQLERVRIRYPEGASTTVSAALSLTGTADQSLVGGTVTILRSGFTPRTDIGSLIFATSRPMQTPTSSSLLRGMQFDLRILSAPNLQLETSLTQGVQASVDLRLRGSPAKPVLLGTVSVNQGELNFFGTNYVITRGTVSFFNAARIEPVLNLDLETIVRAVTVNINISGPVDKPNITYRSDPPLQPQDIVALLAVGRTPTGSTVASQTNLAGQQGAGLYAGAETLLGQAVSAGLSSRLNRFFGVSRVKIDPQLIGLETTPQARLTIEQQFTRDVTLTYVTNLTGALQQLVRLQWDIKKDWSVVGVRDENGVIGGDILFRKRFK